MANFAAGMNVQRTRYKSRYPLSCPSYCGFPFFSKAHKSKNTRSSYKAPYLHVWTLEICIGSTTKYVDLIFVGDSSRSAGFKGKRESSSISHRVDSTQRNLSPEMLEVLTSRTGTEIFGHKYGDFKTYWSTRSESHCKRHRYWV